MDIVAAVSDPALGRFTLETVQLDEPRDDEVLVKIAAVGLCHTDIVAHAGVFGFEKPGVFGHEGAGTVVRCGASVTSFKPGDRVALSFRSCGVCKKCETHHPSYCATMPVLNFIGSRPDGSHTIHRNGEALASSFFGQSSFATHALAYERNIVKLPDDLPFDVAAPLGCGVQTGAGSVMNVFDCQPGSTLIVAGGGTVGLSAVMAAKIRGCATIIVIEPYAARRALASELGATHVVDPAREPDLAAALRAIVPNGADFAFDTTGRADVLNALILALAPNATLGCVGVAAPGTGLPGDLNAVITLGLKVMGIIEGDSDPATFIPAMIAHHKKGDLPVERLIKTYPFSDIERAIAEQHDGVCVKAVLVMPDAA